MRRSNLFIVVIGAALVGGVSFVLSKPKQEQKSVPPRLSGPRGVRPASVDGGAAPGPIGQAPFRVTARFVPLFSVEHQKPILGTIQVDGVTRGERTIASDDAGTFDFTVDLATVRALRAQAKGYAAEQVDADALHAAVRRPLPDGGTPQYNWYVLLQPGNEVGGQVTAGDAGLANAIVRCVQRGLYNSAHRGATAISDEAGRFAITCGEGAFKILASHADYRRSVTDWLTLEGARTQPPRLDLPPGARLSGVVLDEEGNRASEVLVSLSNQPEAVHLHEWNEAAIAGPSAVRSDSNGEFVFEPALGRFQLIAQALDEAVVRTEVELTVDQRVELQLEAGEQVAGVVTLDDAPAVDVMVAWGCEGARTQSPQLSKTDGAFVLKQLVPGEVCFVEARPPGDPLLWSAPGARGGFLTTRFPARIGQRDLRLALRAETTGALEVTFRGAQDEYSGTFTITGLDESTRRSGPRQDTLYSPGRTLTIKAVRAGLYRLTAQLADGVNPQPVEVKVREGGATTVVLTVPDGAARGEARGRIIDARTLRGLDGASLCYSNDMRPAATCIHADADGRFSFTYAAERIAVSVNLEGYRPLNLERAVGRGESGQFGDLALQPVP